MHGEELQQSTNEELDYQREPLPPSNEELETVSTKNYNLPTNNERELQSSNEEFADA